MIKVVYDTNVIVSALLSPKGIPALIVDLMDQELVRLLLSEEIWAEYKEVLLRQKFKFSRQQIQKFLTNISKKGKLIKSKTTVKVSTDPDDDPFLECAVSGKAQYSGIHRCKGGFETRPYWIPA